MEKHFHYATMFAGTGTRDAIAQKRADFLPIYYYQYPDYVRKVLKPDVAILHVSPPDAHGWCSFGVTVDYQQAAAETARLVVAQVNRRMPRSLGPSRIHVTQIHALAEDTPVTTNRFDVDYVVTEYGTARLWGRSNAQRAEALIAIAHPDFREALRKKYQSL